MPILGQYLGNVNFRDTKFVGTIAFKSDEISLPDGSKMALGIDDGHWVLICQKPTEHKIKAYKYDHNEKSLFVDQKAGKENDLKEFKENLAYFFNNVRVEDLVTLLPPQSLPNNSEEQK